MKKIIMTSIICLSVFIIIAGVMVMPNINIVDNGGNQVGEDERVFQGPVPEGYDEEHFRETGETVPLE